MPVPAPSDPKATAAKPATNGNGHSNGNGNGHSNGNGNAAKKTSGTVVLLSQASDALKSTASATAQLSAKLLERAGIMTDAASPSIRSEQFAQFQIDAPACDNCGAITVRNGNCYLCHNCGQSMGCS